ncbi:MAG TPA: hypothetical protein VFR81_17235, partial [Longimicrobium sp.]|nr:hypothetical protein [Longimicrobium sp.]
MHFPRHAGLLLLVAAAAACASGRAPRRGELLTVAELRARQAQGAPDSAAAPRPAPPPPVSRDTAAPAPRVDTAATRREAPRAQAEPRAPAGAAAPGRPARRFPRPRWIQVQDPDPPVI